MWTRSSIILKPIAWDLTSGKIWVKLMWVKIFGLSFKQFDYYQNNLLSIALSFGQSIYTIETVQISVLLNSCICDILLILYCFWKFYKIFQQLTQQ